MHLRTSAFASLRTAAVAGLLAVAALGCDSGSTTDPVLTMRLNGQFVLGDQVVMRYSPEASPQLVLSRTLSGNGMTMYFTFPQALSPGIYTIGGAPGATTVSAVADRRVVAALPVQATHQVTRGTLTLDAVSETTVSGTFETNVSDGAGSHTLSGRFRAMR